MIEEFNVLDWITECSQLTPSHVAKKEQNIKRRN